MRGLEIRKEGERLERQPAMIVTFAAASTCNACRSIATRALVWDLSGN